MPASALCPLLPLLPTRTRAITRPRQRPTARSSRPSRTWKPWFGSSLRENQTATIRAASIMTRSLKLLHPHPPSAIRIATRRPITHWLEPTPRRIRFRTRHPPVPSGLLSSHSWFRMPILSSPRLRLALLPPLRWRLRPRLFPSSKAQPQPTPSQ